MNNSQTLRWLHLSDFHAGSDDYAQSVLYDYLLSHISEHEKPDFVFISGDISQSGKNVDYEKFGNLFILRLKDIVGDDCEIIVVPGNHDVDRSKRQFVSRTNIKLKANDFFDPTVDGLSKRSEVLPRFDSLIKNETIILAAHDLTWLKSINGFGVYKKEFSSYNVGVLSINTAWFSEDEFDKGQLTPGKSTVLAGLKEIKDCDFKIILAHHPLDWFSGDDYRAITALLGKDNVIYLCGHKHKNDYSYFEAAGGLFLVFQCGVAFDVRDSDKWLNGFLWCELDMKKGYVEVEPKVWNKSFQEWTIDGLAFPEKYKIKNSDKWRFLLPSNLSQTWIGEKKATESIIGWDLVDAMYIEKLDKSPDENEIINYFNGRIPNWKLALSHDVPRRQIVFNIVSDILHAKDEPHIHMLLGAGGEGKTTAFYQIIESVVKRNNKYKVLYHRSDNIFLKKKILSDLSDSYEWIIACDEADLFAEDIYILMVELNTKKIKNVHFLLSARHSDWRNTKINNNQWTQFVGYKENALRGLNDLDASSIVKAWSKYKEKGLGKLTGLTETVAAQKLVVESLSEKSMDEGAFLGALLRLRFGDQFKTHVKKLLDRLLERKISKENNTSLLYAFACIAVMHSENMLFLSKSVLARVLKVKSGDLRSKVLYPLGEEAAADTAGEMVFTRHRAIAEVAVDILSNNYEIEIDDIYVDLAKAAEELYYDGGYVTNLGGWRFDLAEHFFDKGNYSLAIKIMQGLLETNSNLPFVCVKLSKLFRKVNLPEQSLKVFRNAPLVEGDRAFFCEWARAEGDQKNYALSVYLFALSMADETVGKPTTNIDAMIGLSGFCDGCIALFEQYNNKVFVEGAYFMADIFLKKIPLPPTATKRKMEDIVFKFKYHVNTQSKVLIFEHFRNAALLASKYCEADLPKWVMNVSDGTYGYLEALLGIREIRIS